MSLKRKKKQIMLQDSALVVGVSAVQDQKDEDVQRGQTHLTNLLTEDGTISRCTW